MVDVRVTYEGPFFDQRLGIALERFIESATAEIGRRGLIDVKERLGTVLKNPTGNYERNIQTDRQRDDLSVNDNGVVYGPWLEGVGSRNQSTRFKGYFTFREITQQLDSKAVGIAQRELDRALERMN